MTGQCRSLRLLTAEQMWLWKARGVGWAERVCPTAPKREKRPARSESGTRSRKSDRRHTCLTSCQCQPTRSAPFLPRAQVADFCTEVVGTPEVTLVGNSIGCIACLSAAALLQDTKGLVLLNSAGDLEIEEEVRVALAIELAWLAGVLGGWDPGWPQRSLTWRHLRPLRRRYQTYDACPLTFPCVWSVGDSARG